MPSNTFFQFKQFRIEQSDALMKVTTEGCLLGAWVASFEIRTQHVLDIGAGTGLLSLMVAQAFPHAAIDAVEPEKLSSAQAATNFAASPWSERLQLLPVKVQDLPKNQYDLMISNPPFFSDSLRSAQRPNQAKHEETLTQKVLASEVSRLLSDEGCAAVLYPEREATAFLNEIEAVGLYCTRRLAVFNRPGTPVFRVIQVFQRKPEVNFASQTLLIRDETGDYSEQFQSLLKGYYLHL